MKKTMRLNEVPIGHYVRIKELLTSEEMRRRLMDLGMVRGTKVKPVLVSPAGDPVAYEVRGAVIALRSRVTSEVLVEEAGK